ncbi:adenylyltransferase/cytidyltransferase family protein [Patescibacteria group bacterium]|jgi:cytidyltransferase-like protein|nr:adenylyltransferase/cytidyltransferase family protein [Patescibacteria group bacterium]
MKIGFTVGVWDLLHEGHRIFMGKCRGECDYLVVGVMTDYWVRVQKGHDRPKESLQKRMENVRPFADRVIAINTLNMRHYLQMSDVWIKSVEQKNMLPEEWPNTVWLPRTPGVSTTEIIERKEEASQ